MTTAKLLTGNLLYEHQTIALMTQIYCQAHHNALPGEKYCQTCEDILDYAATRLDRCPYGQEKPTCNQCPVHCYKPEQKQQVKRIMLFAGPRMLLPHPIRAIKHLLAERKPVPAKVPNAASNRHQRLAIQQKS